MNNNNLYHNNPFPSEAPKKSKTSRWVILGIVAVALLIGLINSLGGEGSSAGTAVPAPTVTVTATLETTEAPDPAPTVTVTETAAAAGSPDACLAALDDAEAVFEIAGDMVEIFREHIASDEGLVNAILSDDVAGVNRWLEGMEDHTERILGNTDKLDQNTFGDNAYLCRNA